MTVLFLSRLQFAAATMFHFLFVPLTLGLSILVAVMETKYARTGDEVYLKMTKFWGKLFLINFAVGIVTGITLEFQFGTNWSRYSSFVGDIFGSLLAIEATAAFFLESTLLGVWIFGWKKLSRKAHATVMWFVAGASNLSALWILIANSWMQHPVGYLIKNGRAELNDFAAVVLQPWALLEFTHVHGADVAKKQPAKLAAMESHWETTTYAAKYLFAIPDEENEKNTIEILPIPGVLSLLATHSLSGEVKGLKAFPRDERPPVFISYAAFNTIVALGFYFALMTIIGWLKRKKLSESPGYLKLMLYSIPLPYLAIELGWVLAEVGRQPWIVYGVMKTSNAVSPIATSQVLTTFVAFIVVYGLLGAVGYYLIFKNARRGPETA